MLNNFSLKIFEEIMFCDICSKDIVESAFLIHSLGCAKRIRGCTKCPECSEYVRNELLSEHMESEHPLCDCGVTQSPEHEKVCPLKKILCEFCDTYYLRKDSDHVVYCGSKTEQCELCSKYIMRKDFAVHQVECLGSVAAAAAAAPPPPPIPPVLIPTVSTSPTSTSPPPPKIKMWSCSECGISLKERYKKRHIGSKTCEKRKLKNLL